MKKKLVILEVVFLLLIFFMFLIAFAFDPWEFGIVPFFLLYLGTIILGSVIAVKTGSIIIRIFCIFWIAMFAIGLVLPGRMGPQHRTVNVLRSNMDTELLETDLVLTLGVGIGPVKFGMTKDEVIKHFGQPDKISGATLFYAKKGICIVLKPNGRVSAIGCSTKKYVKPKEIVADFKGMTSKGIKLGATEEDIIAAYGEPHSRRKVKRIVVLLYRNYSTTFMLEKDKLNNIMTNGLPGGEGENADFTNHDLREF